MYMSTKLSTGSSAKAFLLLLYHYACLEIFCALYPNAVYTIACLLDVLFPITCAHSTFFCLDVLVTTSVHPCTPVLPAVFSCKCRIWYLRWRLCMLLLDRSFSALFYKVAANSHPAPSLYACMWHILWVSCIMPYILHVYAYYTLFASVLYKSCQHAKDLHCIAFSMICYTYTAILGSSLYLCHLLPCAY